MEWYQIIEEQSLISPALLLYPERIENNLKKMIKMTHSVSSLRPHIKTHKMCEIIELQIRYGIDKFKCATLAEAEILAKCRAKDILLAYQPSSINIKRFFDLMEQYPQSLFSTLVDHGEALTSLIKMAKSKAVPIQLWLDLNNGMNRTGIEPGPNAFQLYKDMWNDDHVVTRGFHVYDGHIKDKDLTKRKENCDRDFSSVKKLQEELESKGFKVKDIVAGGSPTFPVHLSYKNRQLSPGTTLLWDAGYQIKFPDLEFLPAAVLLTRVISKPSKNLLCLDLGHKSVASEMSLPRVKFLGDHQFDQIDQHEEHLVVRCREPSRYYIGQCLYAVPYHICPTVSKYSEASIIILNKKDGIYKVAARDQYLA